MIKKIAENKLLASVLCIICAIFTYGGAVNMGWSGFTMAIPFMALWFFIALQSSKTLKITSAIIFAVILVFYGLKKTDNAIFYPAIGMTITLNKDACFNVYSNVVLISDFKDKDDCLNTKESIQDIKKSKIVKAGTIYNITRTKVSHADMGESFEAYSSDLDGEVYINNLSFFNKIDGTALTTTDLSKPYFYYPSLLMYYPIFPLTLLSLLSPRA